MTRAFMFGCPFRCKDFFPPERVIGCVPSSQAHQHHNSKLAAGAGHPKKTAHALEQERPDLLKRRQDWFHGQLDLDPARLVLIDETGLSTKMSPLRGRSPCGDRCRSPIPHGHWKTTTFTGALRLSGMTAPMVLDGAMNGGALQAYVQQVLIPTLAPGVRHRHHGQSAAHKAEGVRNAIEDAGCRLLYLPPYSLDFNPIEKAFAKLKAV